MFKALCLTLGLIVACPVAADVKPTGTPITGKPRIEYVAEQTLFFMSDDGSMFWLFPNGAMGGYTVQFGWFYLPPLIADHSGLNNNGVNNQGINQTGP